MSLPKTVAEVMQKHVTLEVEGIDRMYLNVYQPKLQTERGVASFFRYHRGATFASSVLMEPISKKFIEDIEAFVKKEGIELITFPKKQRKDDVAAVYRAAFKKDEGILFVGKAQEKVRVCRTEKRTNPQTGQTYPWLVCATAMVNQYYFYGIDSDFGPFFLKFSSYFPYNAKLCINGHEYAKRQLAKEGIGFEALDNGVLSCEKPKRLQKICDDLSAAKIDAMLRKWLKRLPHPYTAADRQADYLYDVSILQAEFALTQVLDQPRMGRIFFEEVIRENLDLGRPDQVQLIFNRRVTKRTPGRFRTRVLTEGVVPSLHMDYKHSRIKQYHKEGRALRTETIINDTYDFGIGKRLHNLPALRAIGFEANRRLLHVQKISQDCAVGEATFRQVTRPREVDGQRASALRYGDEAVLMLLSALLVMRLLPQGFRNRDLRDHWSALLGQDPQQMTPGRLTYQLRRLRLHGIIARTEGSQRYAVTDFGLRVALFFTRSYARLIRPGMAEVFADDLIFEDAILRRGFEQMQKTMDDYVVKAKIVA
jgi:hypothetical protein